MSCFCCRPAAFITDKKTNGFCTGGQKPFVWHMPKRASPPITVKPFALAYVSPPGGNPIAARFAIILLGLSRKSVQLFRQTGFFAGCGIFVNEPFRYRFVELLRSDDQSRFGRFRIVACESLIGRFNRRTESGFLRRVQRAAFLVRFYAFDSGFDVWHVIHLLYRKHVGTIPTQLETVYHAYGQIAIAGRGAGRGGGRLRQAPAPRIKRFARQHNNGKTGRSAQP